MSESAVAQVRLPAVHTTSGTIYYSWLWSLRRGRWVRGFCQGLGGCEYVVRPGRYIEVAAGGKMDKDQWEIIAWVSINEVVVDESGRVKYEKTLAEADGMPLDGFLRIRDDPGAPEALRAFVDAMPPRHGDPLDPPDRAYPEGELERMVGYLRGMRGGERNGSAPGGEA